MQGEGEIGDAETFLEGLFGFIETARHDVQPGKGQFGCHVGDEIGIGTAETFRAVVALESQAVVGEVAEEVGGLGGVAGAATELTTGSGMEKVRWIRPTRRSSGERVICLLPSARSRLYVSISCWVRVCLARRRVPVTRTERVSPALRSGRTPGSSTA